MATTTFVDKNVETDTDGTLIVAEWLNEVDGLVHDVFGGASTDDEARSAISVVAEVGTLALLTAIDTSGFSGGEYRDIQGRLTSGDSGASRLIWRTGDQSANVTAKPERFFGPDTDATGASGAWELLRFHRQQVDSLTDLQGVSGQFGDQKITLTGRVTTGDGGEGTFIWRTGDKSTEVTADEVTGSGGDGGIWIAPTSDLTGASGAWERLGVVELLSPWYGVVGDDSADDITGMKKAADRSAETGFPWRHDAGLTSKISAQLVLKSDTHLILDGKINGAFTATQGQKNAAIIVNENAPSTSDYIIDPGPFVPGTRDSGIVIDGFGEIGVHSSVAASLTGTTSLPGLALMACDEFYVGPITIRGPFNEWAFTIWGDDFLVDKTIVRGQTAILEDGIHVLASDKGGKIIAPDIESGDDSIAFGANYNLPVKHVTVEGPRVESNRAYALKFIQNREGSTAAFAAPDQYIEDIVVTGIVGKAGQKRNGLISVIADSTTTDSVRDIHVDGFSLEMGDSGGHDGTNPQAINTRRGKNIYIRGTVKNTLEHAVDCQGGDKIYVDVNSGATQTSNIETAQMINCTDSELRGEIVSGTRDAIKIDGGDVKVLAHITEIPTGFGAVRARNTAKVTFAGHPVEASGATGTSAVRISSGEDADVVVGGGVSDFSEIDQILNNAGTANSYEVVLSANMTKERTISSGTIDIDGAPIIDVKLQGGTSDTLVTANGGENGLVARFRNAEANPSTNILTIQNNSGSPTAGQFDLGGSDYTMDNAHKELVAILEGGVWRQLRRDGV